MLYAPGELQLKMKLLSLWKERRAVKLRHTDIVRVSHQNWKWSKRKTTYYLDKAVREGFLERIRGEHGEVFYGSRFADYKGYFDASEFIRRVDNHTIKQGLMESLDYHVSSFTAAHLVAYGTPRFDSLTPLEYEMMGAILFRFSKAFLDYVRLCDRIKLRQKFEEGDQKLPDDVKDQLFAKRENRTEKVGTALDVEAAHKIYGDCLWDHVFQKIMGDLHFLLVQGTMDRTGVMELLRARREIVNAGLRLSKRIFRGEFTPAPHYNEFSEKLPSYFHFPLTPKSDFESNAYGMIIAPSPRVLYEFSEQIGRIVEDQVNVWSDTKNDIFKVVKKGDTVWEDQLELPRLGKAETRKQVLRDSLIDWISLMRRRKENPIDEQEEKFMLNDEKLREIFSEQEIRSIAKDTRDLLARGRKFWKMIEGGVPASRIRRQRDWFSNEEIVKFRVAEDVESWLPRRLRKAHITRISKLPRASGALPPELIKDYFTKVRKHVSN